MSLTIGYQALIDAAEAEIETLTPEAARALLGDDDVVFVDIRDIRELTREGKIPDAFHATRGMLEFWIDPDSPYFKEIFGSGKRFVFYCQSGWRSALATQTVQRMGLARVCHVGGGFRAWVDAGHPVETVERKR
ncbi:MAG: rhodanese-like domain-containing protein [Gammaproteobacteria bacterium]